MRNLKLMINKYYLLVFLSLFSTSSFSSHGGEHTQAELDAENREAQMEALVTQVLDSIDYITLLSGVTAIASSVVLILVVLKGANYLLTNIRGA